MIILAVAIASVSIAFAGGMFVGDHLAGVECRNLVRVDTVSMCASLEWELRRAKEEIERKARLDQLWTEARACSRKP